MERSYYIRSSPFEVLIFSLLILLSVFETFMASFIVLVGFRLDENPNRMLVAWTTTPWTLPSNLAIAVHPTYDYVIAKGE